MHRRHLARSIAVYGAIILVTIIVSLFVAEFAVRRLYPRFDPSGQVAFTVDIGGGDYVGTPFARRRQVKNTGDYDVWVRFNEAGFRDSTLAGATEKDLYVIGDSFSFGWGVAEEERYSNVLAALTKERVHNLAAPADLDGFARLLRWAIHHGAKPRRLIVGLSEEGEVFDYAQQDTASSVPTRMMRIKGWFTAHSAVYFVLTSASHQMPLVERIAKRVGVVRGNLAGVIHDAYNPTAIASTLEHLRRVTGGYDTTILIIPSRALWTGTEADRTNARRTHDALVSGLGAAGFRVADPRSAFEAGGHPLQYHFVNDGHWKPAAHAVGARLLARALHTPGGSLTQ